ncbi:MAG: TIGR02206 family membrane protein [Phycisphaerales bacterium]
MSVDLSAPAREFLIGSSLHVVTVTICVAAVVGACVLGRQWRDAAPRREFRLRVGWIISLFILQTLTLGYYLWPATFDKRIGLPFHVCDLAVWFAPFALLGAWRWPKSMLYFWGIGLTIAAFIQPAVKEGVAHPAFWMFWIQHTQITGSAVYLVAVLGYRPTARDLIVALATTAVYVAVIIPVNIVLEVNYGYVGALESPVSFVGPWPWRVGVLYGGAILVFSALWAPFAIASLRSRSVHPRHHSGPPV